jgi:hypothetical protein
MHVIFDPEHRMRLLEAERNRKMAASAHAYAEALRGFTNGSINSSDVARWRLCLDLRRLSVGNLGPVASIELWRSRCVILIRRSLATSAHDIIRLGLSLAMAARGSDLPD